jgi:hypothetical protein
VTEGFENKERIEVFAVTPPDSRRGAILDQ